MKNLDDNALYIFYILLIVYFYIFLRSIVYQDTLFVERRRRTAMAEPLHSIWRKGYIILLAVLPSISSRLSRGIESYVVYMVGDDT
jgi:hypothetical protein